MSFEHLQEKSDLAVPLSAIDLFCGVGGLSYGLEQTGYNVLFAADSWSIATENYGRNFHHPALTVDLAGMSAMKLWRQADIPIQAVDLVVGGPPCQGFSIQRIGSDLDDRNNLVLEFGRLVREFHPRMFLMENVPGLLGRRGQSLVRRFEQEMLQAGYSVAAKLVNSAEFGVPQTRRRVFFLGWLTELVSAFVFPRRLVEIGQYRTALDAIADLPQPPENFTPHPGDPLHRRTRLSKLNEMRMRHVPPGGGMADLPPGLRVRCHRDGADRIGHRFVYGRMDPNKPAPTITARFDSFTRGKFGHPYEDRNITLREGARLQTFPDSFQFIGTQEQIAALIGNAVPPLLAAVFGKAIVENLQGSSADKRENSEPLARDASMVQRGLFHNREL